MIFIDPVNKMRPRKELKYFLKNAPRKDNAVSQESLELSDQVDYSTEFTLTPKRMYSLTAQMSVTVLILQTAIEELTQTQFLVSSLNELDCITEDWQLIIQPPPVEKKSPSPLYSDKHPPKNTDGLHYNLIVPILCSDNTIHEFTVILHCNRFFAETHLGNTQLSPQITTCTTPAPYTSSFLSELPQIMEFALDADGEPDQLRALSDTTQSIRTQQKHNTALISGLRIWRIQNGRMRLHIMGDESVGAIFIENILPIKNTHHEATKGDERYDNLNSHFDIEI
ncbi:hypothetical protein [Marinomonas sp. 2405UD68-3]|uniref:hypothetical protein n=1 Tax=Marinomonas sp. 2405UD68-3 TaxID=3391835 RepID=UPI0039C9E391